MTIHDLPLLNAILNSTSAILLLAGYYCIRRGKWKAHGGFMISAVVVSAGVLVSYLIYHAKIGHRSSHLGMTPLGITYYTILFSHLILAMVMVPMIVMVLWRAARRQWEKHRSLAQPTLFIWLYVSITGVVIYWMLYHVIKSP
jgi:uncharacterized membrane protein YozB (DUF420 family)